MAADRRGAGFRRRRVARRVLALVIAFVALMAVASCGGDRPVGADPVAADSPVWGLADNLHRDPASIGRKLEAMQGLGVEMIRLDIGPDQQQVEAVRRARAAGFAVLGVVYGPREPEAYADWIEQVVRRFSPMGVHHYEIWNEPNLTVYWPTADDPEQATSEYMALVRAAYPRVKAADPESTVLVGALSRREYVGGRPNDWVAAMYEMGLKGNFDAISVHPYTDPDAPGEDTSAALVWRQVFGPWSDRNPSVRDLMVQNGDGDKKVWITEFAAPTGGDLGSPVDETRQAEILRAAIALSRRHDWIGGFLWYSLRDAVDGSEQFGLLRADWSPKPALAHFAEAARTE